jgi:hypothetical protein
VRVTVALLAQVLNHFRVTHADYLEAIDREDLLSRLNVFSKPRWPWGATTSLSDAQEEQWQQVATRRGFRKFHGLI